MFFVWHVTLTVTLTVGAFIYTDVFLCHVDQKSNSAEVKWKMTQHYAPLQVSHAACPIFILAHAASQVQLECKTSFFLSMAYASTSSCEHGSSAPSSDIVWQLSDMAAAHGQPTFMQDVLAPLVEIERLQARVAEAVLTIQNLYDDTPLQNRTVRLALHQSMVQLWDANLELERQKLFHYLNII